MSPISAKSLMETDYPEPSYLVPGLIPEGVSVLAGKPKLGKSFFALNVALAVASGGTALGSIEVDRNEVLFLALEDTRRRLKRRLSAALNGEGPPDGLLFESEWPKFDKGGLDALESLIAERPATKLVVVDTLERVRATPRRDSRLYSDDYASLEPLKTLADKLRIGVVVVHHTRKLDALDPTDMISGSTGLSAAADTLLVLQRERARADAVLHVTGRDVEERELALKFSADMGLWTILGEAEDFRRSKERQEIVDLLRKEKTSLSPKDVSSLLGKKYDAVKYLMWQMGKDGDLLTEGGKYALTANPANPLTSSDDSVRTVSQDNKVRRVRGVSKKRVSEVSGQEEETIDRLYFEEGK